MEIKSFNYSNDYKRILDFLSDCYRDNHNMTCWLPERFDDLINRIDVLHRDERGKPASQEFIYIWEEDGAIVGVVLPDGDSFNSCIKTGYEYLYPQMLDCAEEKLTPLFRDRDGNIDCLIISHDSLTYQAEELLKRGYRRDAAGDYDNVCRPLETDYVVELPDGFYQTFGEEIKEQRKITACHYGFHPIDDDDCLDQAPREGNLSYQSRKENSFFKKDNFESLIVSSDGDVCSFCFCYVNRLNSTAFIEPVCRREKYRRQGFARQMLYGVINRLKEMGIESCYINSFDWRKKVYNAIGFETIDSIGFWHKKILC